MVTSQEVQIEEKDQNKAAMQKATQRVEGIGGEHVHPERGVGQGGGGTEAGEILHQPLLYRHRQDKCLRQVHRGPRMLQHKHTAFLKYTA